MTVEIGKRLAAAVVIIISALLLAWLALREAVLRAFPTTVPIVRLVAGHDPRYLGAGPSALSIEKFVKPIAPAVRRRITETLQQLPLADEPFVTEGRGAFQDGDLARSIVLLEEARRRAPRNRTARFLLLDRYARANRLKAAVGEIAVLNRLIPDASDTLVTLVAQIAADPRMVPAIRTVLATDPILANATLAQMANRDAEPAVVLAMAAGLRTRVLQGGAPDWRNTLVATLARRRNYGVARRLWIRFNHIAGPATLVFDETFQGTSAAGPFGWNSGDEGAGSVDWRRRGGADISYYGRQSGILLNQLLTLAAGRYRLVYLIDGNVTATGSRLAWQIRCVGAPQPLADVPIGRAHGNATFAVTAGCPAQQLSLEGTADEFPQEINTTLRRISITPVGNAR